MRAKRIVSRECRACDEQDRNLFNASKQEVNDRLKAEVSCLPERKVFQWVIKVIQRNF